MKRRIVTTTSVFPEDYSPEMAIDRLARLGFEGLDMALDYCAEAQSPFVNGDHLHWARSLRERAERAGVPYTHSHAPGEAFNNPLRDRSIEAAGALGARYMVVHPVCRSQGEVIVDPEAFIRINAETVKSWLDLAQKWDVVILSENLLWGASCDPRVIASLVKEVSCEGFGWCYDTGHANLFGYTPKVLEECAVPPLSLHMQDNRGDGRDEHLIPGEGTVDWDQLIQSLGKVGYRGDCVLEAHHQSLVAPDADRDGILGRLLASARVLRRKMEEI